MKFQNTVGVLVPDIMLPRQGVDMEKWAVVACDQYTSQPEYWEEVDRIVGGAPSTLRLMLPEMYLEKPDEPQRIAAINATMRQYMADGTLEHRGEGLVYVERYVDGKTRHGLMLALDLENYDYSKGSTTLIRATEGTIVERIPPRLRIRRDAPLELPHILVLIDDPMRTVIEPLGQSLERAEKVYDFELMQNGGHIKGYFIQDEELINATLRALEALADASAFAAKYGGDKAPMLFAMGDGNHSFATAKTNWERIKQALPPEEAAVHPARYALVELENVHDEGMAFEPIHRVLFNIGAEGFSAILNKLREQNGNCEAFFFSNRGEYEAALPVKAAKNAHMLPFVNEGGYGFFRVTAPAAQLEVGTLQNALDATLLELPGASIDYIHGEDIVYDLGKRSGNLGFLLPTMDKSAFFRTVVFDGALPRKTFSMGEAHEKRYYLECRMIEAEKIYTILPVFTRI